MAQMEGLLAALVFGGVGVAMLGFARRLRRRARAAAGWPTTPGRVLESRLERSHDPDGGPGYTVIVRYAYAVQGRDYESDRIAFGYAGTGDEAFQRRLLERVPVGAQVAVRYDPDQPATAALGVADQWAIRILTIVGAAFASVGVAVIDAGAAALLIVAFLALFFASPFFPSAERMREALLDSVERLDAPR